MATVKTLTVSEATDILHAACGAVGADRATAVSLADAVVSAELHGRSSVGFPHFLDYLDGFAARRINCRPSPRLTRPSKAVFACDADEGISQLGFDLAINQVVDCASSHGVAVFLQRNCFPSGEVGYYVRRLARMGIVALAFANANAVMASAGGRERVFGTNPLAFGFPMPGDGPPVVVDQASSESALVNIIAAAREGRPIPAGWAIDQNGQPTTDAEHAIKGALVPFGGDKGSNIALMVELLAAGLSGGAWSMDAPDFSRGPRSPQTSLTVIAIKPDTSCDNAVVRTGAQIDRLEKKGVYIPGGKSRKARTGQGAVITVPSAILDNIEAIIGRDTSGSKI